MKNIIQRIMSLMLTIMMFTSLLVLNELPALASGGEAITIGDYRCIEWENGVSIERYTGTDSLLKIPAELGGKKVIGTTVDFEMSDNTTKLVVESGVKELFIYCDTSNLEQIVLPDNLERLSWVTATGSAFYKGQNNWRGHALYAGNWMIAVEKNYEGTLTIQEGTVGFNDLFWFGAQMNLTKIIFPGSMKKVNSWERQDMLQLEDLIFQEGVEEIGMYLEESDIPNLKGLWFPDSVTNIELKIHADEYFADDGMAHFFQNVKPTVYCSTGNIEAIEYAQKYGLTIRFDVKVPINDGDWKQDNVGWWYQRADGSYPKNGWEAIDGEWYYFNASGYRVENQWVGNYYLQDDGVMATNQWVGAYYVGADGVYISQNGWLQIDDDWYYLGNGGVRQTGWQAVDGTWYYFETSGKMVTGWQSIGGTWYYFNASGAMVTGWQKIDAKWYYFFGSGAMAKEQWVGNYYLQEDGSMAVSKWIGNYYVDENGVWQPNA